MLARCVMFFYGACLLTLPWVGVGLLKITTGRDWGGGLQPSWLFLALAMMCATADRLRSGFSARRTPALPPLHVRRWWLSGSVAVLVSVLLSVAGLWLAPSGESADATVGRFAKQVAQLIIMASFAAWPALWTRGRRRWTWTVRLLLFGGLLQVVYGLLQGLAYYHPLEVFAWLEGIFTSNPSILSGSVELYLGDSFQHVPRLRGTVCEPLYLGNYLLFLGPFLLVPVWSERSRRLIAGLFLVLLLGTWSRGAWLGLAGQMALAGAVVIGLGKNAGFGSTGLETRKFRKAAAALLILLAVVPLVGWVAGWDGLLFPYRRLVQTFSSQDWSNLTRFYSMQAAWRGFLLSPILGLGWGQFGWHFPALVDPMGLQSQFTWPVVNNLPLLILCETGLVGFMVFLAWGVGLVRAVGSRLASVRDSLEDAETCVPHGRLLFAAMISGTGVWLQLLTFSQYNLPHIWVSVGLLLAILADGNLRTDQTAGPNREDSGT